MKRAMNYKNNILILFLMTLTLIFFSTSLFSVNKEDNDMLFIIGLYDHEQFDMAKKQIQIYENEYSNSKNTDLLLFLKANIAFAEYDYSSADSLYSILLTKVTDQPMLSEVLVNRAYIKFDWKEYLKALNSLSQAENITTDRTLLYRVELLKGRIYNAMYNPYDAQQSFLRALVYQKNDATAISELTQSYLSTNNISQAKDLIDGLINLDSSPEVYASSFNVYIDYLLANEDYQQILKLESSIRNKKARIPDSMLLRFAKTHILLKDFDLALAQISQVRTYQDYRKFLTGLIYAQQDKDVQADSVFAELSSAEIPVQNQLADSNEDIAISSWLERIKILYKTSPEQALTYMNTYIAAIGNESVNPVILYTYGSLLFKSKKYQEAANTLISLKNLEPNSPLSQNIQIMLSDIWFAAGITDKARIAYSQYLKAYPQGKFRLHALYNVALIDFEQKDYKSASVNLKTVLAETKDEELIEKAQFMLADIDFYLANYNKAIEQYKLIKNKVISSNLTNYRIAQSLYYSEDYQSASELIPLLTVDSTNAFQILLLVGNINFNLKQYTSALDTYYQASKFNITELERQEIDSYIALTLYRLGNFKEASELYLKLSREKESPQAYLVMAAKASYHAKDYQQSLMLFKKFIEENPQSEFYNNVLASIGSIYYNQKEYAKATQVWVSLVKRFINNEYFSDDEQIILQTTFSGLQWCLKQDPDQAVLDDLNDSIDTFKSSYIRFELQYLLLKIYYGSEQWGDLLQMADDLRSEFPHKENNEIRRYVAGSLSKLSRFNEADSVYQTIYKIEPTADILTEWAELELHSGKSDAAILKLDQALTLDAKPDRLFKLLSTIVDVKPDTLSYYWSKWESTFNPMPDQAQIIWLQWNYDKANYAMCETLANPLLLNENLVIRSKAQLIKGLALYQTKNYESAILELYKTIYLYSDLPDIVLKAKLHVVKSYLAMGQTSEALKVYTEIKDSLSTDEVNELEAIFSEKQINNE